MHGFLLAAGFGTRLWPLSDRKAKPAFPFLSVPLIRYVADMVVDAGVDRLWVNTHHAADSVEKALHGYARARVELVHEPEILGTAGALVNARDKLVADEVLVANAKIVSDLRLKEAFALHRQTEAIATLVCVPNKKREFFTHVDTNSDGLLQGFVDKEQLASVKEPLTYTGVQILSRRFFDFLPAPGFSDTVKDVLPKVLAAKGRVAVFKTEAEWKEFSTVARYLDLHLDATQGEGHIDPSATLGGAAQVKRSVVWAHARIGEGASLYECVVGEGAIVPPGFAAKRKVLLRAVDVADPAEIERRGGTRHGDLVATPIA